MTATARSLINKAGKIAACRERGTKLLLLTVTSLAALVGDFPGSRDLTA